MFRGGEGARRGPRMDRMAGLVLAIVVGALVPVVVVTALARRDPVPRACGAGPATRTAVEGALLYTTGSDLWYSEGVPGKPKKLVDYPPIRPQVTGGATPSPGPTSPAAPSPSVATSPGPALFAPRVLDADISPDRKQVAFIVQDPTDRYGAISMRVMSPLDPPGTRPTEITYGAPDREASAAAQVRVLDSGKVLFFAPLVPPWLPSASPAPAGAPSASPEVSPGVGVFEYVPVPKPAIVAQAPLAFFLDKGRSSWPDAVGYRPPPPLPSLESRVLGPVRSVAGVEHRSVGTPLAQRRLALLALGTAGNPARNVKCALAAGVLPAAFSPDESHLALTDGPETLLLDLAGTHAPSHLLTGRVLAWR